MIFKDKKHENSFHQILDKMQINYSDTERTALAYLLALNEDCCNHINDLYSFEERIILPEGLDQEWQTHTSLKTTRLAFNLYNGYCYDGQTYTDPEGYENDLPIKYYCPVHLFACSYAPYYWEAIKIRYPEYTEEE